MTISYRWLLEFITLPAESTPEIIADRLTMLGLEVESLRRYEQVQGGLDGVVAGKVRSCVQHPGADRLKICQVDAGGELLQIVCGASNVASGQTVPVALVGTTLYPTSGEQITLKRTKIRGEESNGMICAEDELGLGTSHDGILVLDDKYEPGTPASQIFDIYTDWLFEIGITPNRADALSHYGVARDLAASLSLQLHKPALRVEAAQLKPCTVQVQVLSPERCPRYAGLVIEGITIAESPAWLKQKLLAIGARPINNVVDATNYVLYELGQPLHAFDLAHVQDGKLSVETLPEGTKFRTLFDHEIALSAEDLMIADATGGLCIAGVLGGKKSGVTETTTSIFLESAVFEAVSVRKSKYRHQLFSDASYRFERGVDPEMTTYALQRAADLIMDIAGGTRTAMVDLQQKQFLRAEVVFSYSRARTLMGKPLTDAEIKDILKRLDIEVLSVDGKGAATLSIPTYRIDVTRFEDVVEDILRVHGYNEVAEAERINASVVYTRQSQPARLREATAQYLTSAGWHETVTNSLVAQRQVGSNAIPMANPLSEENAWLRTNLLPSLLEVVGHNVNRQETDLQLFDQGKTYQSINGAYMERYQLAMLISGKALPEQWLLKERKLGYFDLKGACELLLQRLGLGSRLSLSNLADDPELLYGCSYAIGKSHLVRLGEVRPELCESYAIDQPVYYAQWDWETVEKLAASLIDVYQPLPKFPAVRRDLSLVVPAGVTYAQIEQAIIKANPSLVRAVWPFDVFSKEGVTSYAVAIQLQDNEQTLTDKPIEKTIQRALSLLEELGVKLRGAN